MAYDEGLAERIRIVVEGERGVSEKKMFGGVAFLRGGRMFVGIVKHDLMVRVGPDRYEQALREPHVRPMDFTGKPMVGYVYVAPEGIDEDDQLATWIRLGLAFASTLATKPTTGPKSKPKRKPKKSRTR